MDARAFRLETVALLLSLVSVTIASAGTGALDPSFGTGGRVTFARPGNDTASAVAIAPGGKIVSAGTFGSGGFAVVRHLANGTTDTSFGLTGDGTVVDVTGSTTGAQAVVVHSDGRITTAGYFYNPPFRSPATASFRVSRLNPNGTPDTSFGTTGTVSALGGLSLAKAVLLQPDGKTIAVGYASTLGPPPQYGYSPNRFAAVRFNSNGSLDTGFNGTGSVTTAVGTLPASANDAALQSNGDIVAVGNLGAFPASQMGFVRWLANGSVDVAKAIPVGTGNADYANAVAIQADGKIVIAGASDGRAAIVRLLPDASLDATFGLDGRVLVPASQLEGVAIQADGRIVAVGMNWELLRFNADGSPDASFASGGGLVIPMEGVGEGIGAAWSIALQPDGRIVVAGSARPGVDLDLALARIDPLSTPALMPDPVVLDFGGQAMGATAPPRNVTITNTSGATRTVTGVSVSNPRFVATPNCGTLAPGASCIVAVTYSASIQTPPLGGRVAEAGMLVVASDGGSAAVSLLGTAVFPLTPSPTSLDYGGQSMNTTSPSKALTLTNTGASTLTVSSVTASTYFAVTHDCSTLAPAESCTANVTFTPTAQGSLNGTLTIQASNGTLSVGLTGTGEKSLVTHYYLSILRRAPDAGGKAYWESEAVRMPALGANLNETWYAMATYFYFSPEYTAFNRDDTGFVTDLYNTFFNRPPDIGGLAFWTGQLAGGMPREVVLTGFMFSPEFQSFTQAIFGNTAARKEVDTVVDFYRGILSRLPDTDGFNYWVGQFRAAQCAGTYAAAAVVAQAASISGSFAHSAEYVSRNRTNPQFVGDLYNSFLRRGGDLGGVQFWIAQLESGAYTRDDVRGWFIASPEFTNRVNAMIAQGCLP